MKEVFTIEAEFMKQQLCCSHTGSSNRFFTITHFSIACGLWDNADGLVCMYEFMQTFMSVCISLYSVYVCMCACMYVCIWRMTLSMSNGKKIGLVDSL